MAQQPPGPPYGPPPYGPSPYGQMPYGYAPPPPRPGVVRLAPLGIAEVFGGALGAWRRSWRVVLGLGLVLAAVGAALTMPSTREGFLLVDIPPNASFDRVLELATPHLRTLALLLPVSFLASAVLNGLAMGLFAVVGRRAVLGRPAPWSRVWAEARPQLWRLLGLSLVFGVVTGLGLLLCIVPGVIIWTLWSLSFSALVTERLTIGQALRRSYRLVLGDAWRVFGVLLLVGVAAAAVTAALNAPASAVVQFAMDPAFTDASWTFVGVQAAVGVVGSTLTMAFLPLAALLLYVDQRIRRERYDLQLVQEAAAPDA